MTARTSQPVRVAVVSPCPPGAGPVAAHTAELIRMLRAVAPGIAPSLWTIAPDGEHPGRAGTAVDGVIVRDDPSAYHRAAARLQRLGTRAAVVQFGPGTAGGPHGRYVLGLGDELHRLGVPYLVTLHGLRPSMRPDEADVVRALCRPAAGVIVLSRSARAAVVHNRLAPPERVAVVAAGAPPELTAPAGAGDPAGPPVAAAPAGDGPLAEVGPLLAGAGPLLATVGLVRPQTGVEVAVAALPLLAPDRPGVRYAVVGPAGARYATDLRRLAHDLGVADRFLLVDTEPGPADLAALLRATDVYLEPDLDRGRTDSGPLGCALAAGRRVVVTDSPFGREVVPATGGLLVPPGDPAALAAAAGRLLDSPPPPTARWPSSAVTAEQIAGLVGLVLGPGNRRAQGPCDRRPSALGPGRT